MDMIISGVGQISPGEYDKIDISGSCNMDGPIRCKNFHSSGSVSCFGAIQAYDDIRILGVFSCSSIESENVHIDGKIDCSGLLNAEKIAINTCHSVSEIGSIGGSVINITTAHDSKKIHFLFFKYERNTTKGQLIVRDSIEGDKITLENVTAENVVGRIVKIGKGCRIKHVCYSESIEVDSESDVNYREQI